MMIPANTIAVEVNEMTNVSTGRLGTDLLFPNSRLLPHFARSSTLNLACSDS